jgi:hypothetical protein
MPTTLSSQSLGMSGPVDFNLTWSDPFGLILDARYSRLLNAMSSYALEAALGFKENRVNVTLGHAFTPNNRFKLTVERLAQKQSFDFDSGSTKQWVSQYAGGAEFQHLLGKGAINNFSLGGYYARALNKTLDTVIYQANQSDWYNYRHIAGAASKGFNASVGVRPWRTGIVTLTGYYDSVRYDNKYQNVSASNASQLGYGIALNQYLSDSLQASAHYAHRAVYRTVEAGFQWSHNVFHHTRALALSLMGSHTKSDNVPHDNRLTVGLQYYFMPLSTTYHMPTFQMASLKMWVAQPAVRMNEVLAASDQMTQKITVTWPTGFQYDFDYLSTNTDGLMTYKLIISPAESDSNEPVVYDVSYNGKSKHYTASEISQGIEFDDLYPNTPQTFTVKAWDGYTYSKVYTKKPTTKKGDASWDIKPITFHLDKNGKHGAGSSITFSPEECSVKNADCKKRYSCSITESDHGKTKSIKSFDSSSASYTFTKAEGDLLAYGAEYTLDCTATNKYDHHLDQNHTFTIPEKEKDINA